MDYHHQLLLFHTVTPLHVGCGQDVGVVDLPVIRERTTGYPFIPGSGTRGALRAAYQEADGRPKRSHLFGPEAEEIGPDDDRYAGSVAIHDARLLLLPVRSSPQVYVWLTSPTALRRLARDLEVFDLGLDALKPGDVLFGQTLEDDQFLGQPAGPLYLEEYEYRKSEGDTTELERWSRAIGEHLGLPELASRTVLVSDASFHHFAQFATVVQQHNKLTSAKTVDGGALFSLEAVPPDAVFHGLVGATDGRWAKKDDDRLDKAEVLAKLREGYGLEGEGGATTLHLGGKESIGLGVTRLVWVGSGEGSD